MYRMTSSVLSTVILLLCALKFGTSQAQNRSCKGQCGGEYYRGESCQCDYGCLTYGECCKDYVSQCTTKDSCKGRCQETFKRGSLCSCDPDCMKYKQCCSDFELYCPVEDPTTTTTELSSTFSEGNQEDDSFLPQDSPTSPPTEELGDDMYSDDFSNNDVENPEASLIPESSSDGSSLSTTDLLDQDSTEPTQGSLLEEITPETLTEVSKTDSTTSDDAKLFTVRATTAAVPAESTDASDTGKHPPQPTEALGLGSIGPTSASVSEVKPTDLSSAPGATALEQVETQPIEASFPSDEPEATSKPFGTQNAVTVLESSQVTTTLPPPPPPELTTIQGEATSNPSTDGDSVDAADNPPSLPADPEGSFTSVSPSPVDVSTDPDAVTAHVISSTAVAQDVTTDSVIPVKTTADPAPVTPKPEAKPQDKPGPEESLPAKPTTKPLLTPQDAAQTPKPDDPKDYQSDDSHDTNLCSGRPISGVTTLKNGTIVVFRGHYFWFLDRNRVPGPARGITQVWGVPSPIDTSFTRCNCQGKTYIFKGGRYWRFENDVLDRGYPRAVQAGFDGLQGHITGALSVPQYRSRRESVYFFKRGGVVQKYSYQFGTSPSCGRKVQYAINIVRNRKARQAVSVLGPTINIQASWRGFPSTVTAAASIPSSSEPEGYKYYVFSRSKSYQVRMDGERPAISIPASGASTQGNNVFKCPQKVNNNN